MGPAKTWKNWNTSGNYVLYSEISNGLNSSLVLPTIAGNKKREYFILLWQEHDLTLKTYSEKSDFTSLSSYSF